MAINLPNGLLKLLGIDPSTIEISLSDSGNSFNGTNANEHIQGNGGGDSINAGGGSDVVEGGSGGDSINGQAGNDYIEGGTGGDSLNGGNGDRDTLGYSQSAAGVTITLNSGGGGQASGGDAQGDSIGGFENVVGSLFADTITGNNLANMLAGLAGNDTLRGMGGNDVLVGGVGADVLDGGTGTDTADYSTSVNPVHLLLGGVSSGGDAQGDTFISIEKFVGTAGADVFDGSASLTGFSADGGGGGDTMIGGHGDDVLSLGAAAAVAGFAALAAAGGELGGGDGNDIIIGGDNDDTEFGGAGNDLMSGGGGNDFIDSGEGDDNIDGGDGDDFIRCGPGDDTVSGGAGDDTLNGSDGLNDYDGGAGINRYVASDTEGFGASGSSIKGGEGALFNVAEGDVEEYDHMDVHDRSDKVDIELTDGTASLAATAASTSQMRYTFDGEERLYNVSSIEGYSLTAFDDSMIDNSEDHILFGGDGNDFLDGRGGDDQLFGGGGNDTLVGGDGNDFLYAGFGVTGGNETLYGGLGEDQFAFASVEELSSASTFIQDFVRGDGDIIDLSLIDANTTTEDSDAFVWVGSIENLTGAPGELAFLPGGGDLEGYSVIFGDVNGDDQEGGNFSFYVSNLFGDPTAEFFVL
jgi:Ca2+-binding RTX toxin-like protein